jgi:hypothetical protein
MVRRKMFTQKLFRKTKSPQTRAALQKNSSAGLINISASTTSEEFVRFFHKESQNGLEDPKDRRSIGRHGNQHVRLRRPQISGGDSLIPN